MIKRNNKIKTRENKMISLILIFTIIIANINFNFSTVVAYSVSTSAEGINAFPESYRKDLTYLQTLHPNWKFVAVNTNLDWNYVIDNETVDRRSLVPITKDSTWKRDNTEIESGWVNASRLAVEYTMDPRNYLNEEKIFQFEVNEFNSAAHTKAVIEQVLYGTSMFNRSEYKNNGIWTPMNKTYSDIILSAGITSNVSAAHLASRIIQENGGKLDTSKTIGGSTPGYLGYYNFMNVGANATGSGTTIDGVYLAPAVKNALDYAVSKAWTNPELAINGASNKLRSTWLNFGQDTVYFEKFDVNFVATSEYLFGSQYMTNIIAPSSESTMMYNAYKHESKLNTAFTFRIPVYNGMPGTTLATGFTTDNTRIYLDDEDDIPADPSDTFNIRVGPSINDSKIGSITLTNEQKQNKDCIATITQNGVSKDYNCVITRVAIGQGTDYDKVQIRDQSGTLIIEGYVANCYVRVLSYSKVTSIGLNKTNTTLVANQSETLNITYNPIDAWYKDVTWSSSNNSVATVDQNGKITAVSVGTANITATTIETGKAATCAVTVQKTLAGSIAVQNTEYPLVVGKYLQLEPIILPITTTDKNYDIAVEDSSIAIVENGKVKGLKAGSTKVTFTTKDGSNKSCTFTVNVTESVVTIANLTVNNDSTITKVALGTIASSIKGDITTTYTKKILNSNNVELQDTDKVGTGTKVQILNNGNLIDEYTIAIYGDISGDGVIDSLDILKLRQRLLNAINFTSIQYKAANISKDTTNTVDSLDLLKLRQHLLNVFIITQ